MTHDVQWYSPAPLWSGRLENGSSDRMRQPALLQFDEDDFMGELQRVLSDEPGDLSGKLATNSEEAQGEEAGAPLSFYQPAHKRYYLVTASLVCRERGLPDRAVDTTNEERAAFVLRRLVTTEEVGEETTREYGWTGSAWKPVHDPGEGVAEEEKPVKMFPKSYRPQAGVAQMKGDRRVWAGLIPAGKRETFETAPVLPGEEIGTPEEQFDLDVRTNGAVPRGRAPEVFGKTGGDGETSNEGEAEAAESSGALSLPEKGNELSDPRKTKFDVRVLGAFRKVHESLTEPGSEVGRDDVRDPLVFAWLDLWEFLGEHFPDVQQAIADDDPVGTGDPDVLRVLDAIDVRGMGDWETATDALRAVAKHRSDVESGTLDGVLKVDDLPSEDLEDDAEGNDLVGVLNNILAEKVLDVEGDEEALKKAVNDGLGALEDPSTLTGDLKPPATDPVGVGRYVVRCVYKRPHCPPPERTWVSRRSEVFQLASFFDAGAPARDVNITLPSAAMEDLRNTSKSVSLVFTEELRRQAERVQELTISELDDGKVGEAPKVNIGMICSLSIPIITICALILLLVIVVVLNIVFWWLPFFKICFPIPTSD
jgi:hypothetical protein